MNNKNIDENSNKQIIILDENNFDQIISSKKPTLVDFWATWCGPCQFMLPVFDKLAKKYSHITFGRLNVDDNQDTSSKFEVYAIPTFILYSEGKILERAVGAVGEEKLQEMIEKYSS
ncbi:MAG: thioredoxin [Nitrososphaeraceae archaeon]